MHYAAFPMSNTNATHAAVRSKLAALPGVSLGAVLWGETYQATTVTVNDVVVGRVIVERVGERCEQVSVGLAGVGCAPHLSFIPGKLTATGIVRALRGAA